MCIRDSANAISVCAEQGDDTLGVDHSFGTTQRHKANTRIVNELVSGMVCALRDFSAHEAVSYRNWRPHKRNRTYVQYLLWVGLRKAGEIEAAVFNIID